MSNEKMLSIDLLNECFLIGESGDLLWKKRPLNHFKTLRACAIWNAKYPYKIAGMDSLNPKGSTKYKVIRLTSGGKYFHLYAHRVLWAIRFGSWPESPIDHIDGNGLNNSPDNLRLAEMSVGGKNKPVQKNSKTGVPGVSIHNNGRYRAQACSGYVMTHLGYFSDFFSAVCAKKSFELSNGFHDNHGRKSIGVRVK